MKKNNEYKFALIGGDARQLIAAARLHEVGYGVNLYGFGDSSCDMPVVDTLCCSGSSAKPQEVIQDISKGAVSECGTLCKTPEEAIEGCDAVILPLPASGDGVHISMPLSEKSELTLTGLAGLMSANGVRYLCGGKLGAGFTSLCEAREIKVFDYFGREEFAIANAVPTAEGAIEIAMRELPITLCGATALIVGYGRIGRVLAERLRALGMDVTVSARRMSDLAWIKAGGYGSVLTGEIHELLGIKHFDVIFNTVPHTVLGKRELELIPAGTLIIDLASRPGGVDIATANKLSHNVIWALSLPGKVAPVTSGHIIADTLLGYLEEEITR